MDEDSEIVKGRPAPYPETSVAEAESRNIFQDLIDARFIRGEIKIMDKYPNSDGILEITDVDGFPVGKIDIQLKTLSPENYASPKYQCQRSYLKYCEESVLPTILIVVNTQEKKAYWLHIDRIVLTEIVTKMRGESISLRLPLENCIDTDRRDYIDRWTQKAHDVWQKLWNYDDLQLQKKQLEGQLTELTLKLRNPINLSLPDLKAIHNFLDHYNYILDREFSAVKQILYPDFWKIGIGIINYHFGDYRFLLYPVEFNKDQTLVKEVKPGDYEDVFKAMSTGNVLLLAGIKSDIPIRESPVKYAYQLLESTILRIAGKYNFPIAATFVAHEYIFSFIERYHIYMDIEKGDEKYSLKELKYKLYNVMPMQAATGLSFGENIIEYKHSIDIYHDQRPSEYHQQAIKESIKKLNAGFVPRVNVTITSELYNINLINYYINFLEELGLELTERIYQTKFKGVLWNKESLLVDLRLFFEHFYQIYSDYIINNFPLIYHSLEISQDQTITLVHVIYFDEVTRKAYVEVYLLRPSKPIEGQILTFLAEDENSPINRNKFGIERKYDCKINEEDFTIISMHGQPLDFFKTISPMYALINEKLSEKLEQFFRNKQRRSAN